MVGKPAKAVAGTQTTHTHTHARTQPEAGYVTALRVPLTFWLAKSLSLVSTPVPTHQRPLGPHQSRASVWEMKISSSSCLVVGPNNKSSALHMGSFAGSLLASAYLCVCACVCVCLSCLADYLQALASVCRVQFHPDTHLAANVQAVKTSSHKSSSYPEARKARRSRSA